jgi:hypothetical protein
MVKDERVGSPKESALEVLRRTFGSEKKKCCMVSLLNSVVEQKLAWIHALIPIDPQFYMKKLKCNNKIHWHENKMLHNTKYAENEREQYWN